MLDHSASKRANLLSEVYDKHAICMLRNGYSVVPVLEARKLVDPSIKWRQHCWQPMDEHALIQHYKNNPHHGVGMACGRFTVAIDIDTPCAEMNEKLKNVAFEHFGASPLIRQGQAPKMALIYRAEEPVLSARLPKLDILALSAQLVAFGVHEQTQMPYQWIGGESPITVPVAELPSVNNNKIIEFLSEVADEMFGDRFQEFELAVDDNFLPLFLSSRSLLAKSLLQRLAFGKKRARRKALDKLEERVPTGCWGLVWRPTVKGGINWNIQPNGENWVGATTHRISNIGSTIPRSLR